MASKVKRRKKIVVTNRTSMANFRKNLSQYVGRAEHGGETFIVTDYWRDAVVVVGYQQYQEMLKAQK
jgi:hypothetical protein